MSTKKYTVEEEALLDYVEKENPPSISSIEIEKGRYRQIFTDNINKRKQVSLRLLEADLRKLKTKAIAKGIPYQTLIGSVIHQYVNGNLVSKD